MTKSYLQATRQWPLRSGSYEASEIIESLGGPSWIAFKKVGRSQGRCR